MDSAVEKLKGFTKSTQDFIDGLLHRRQSPSRRNPIEILKRLQREAFSDSMKLRDRQDKVERMLTFYGTRKGNPFQETGTLIRGEVDMLGAILLMGDVDQKHYDAIDRAGIKTGVESRFSFHSTVREKDTLVVEFVGKQKRRGYVGDASGSSLSLAKLFYKANAGDWFSAIAIPVGAQFRDFDITNNFSHQGKGLTDLLSLGPPLLNQHNGSAIGLTVRKSNIVASLAQSVCGTDVLSGFNGIGHYFSTFGQVACQLPRGVKVSVLGLHQVPKMLSSNISLGVLTIPVRFLKRYDALDTMDETSASTIRMNTQEIMSTGAIALRLESELDEYTRVGGWIEMTKSNPKHVQWAVNFSDVSEDDFGWGMSVGGIVEGPRNWDHFQVESYVKFNLGKRFSLKPGLAYIVEGNSRNVGFMLRTNWSI